MGVFAGSPFVSSASYPNFAGKHAEEAMFTPADFVAYLRRAGTLDSYQPPAAWCCVISGPCMTMCCGPRG